MKFLLLLAGVAGSCLAANVPTFSADVYPIVRSKCQGCHRPGEVAPMAFTDYKDTRPWAKAIREAVLRGSMPPWHADKSGSVPFANDRSLTPDEQAKIAAWVEGGAAEGSARDYPKPKREEGGWRLGKPDVVMRLPGYNVQAKGDVPYTFIAFPTGFKEDTWIAAAEWRIDKRAVVHHMNAFVRPPGSSYVEGYPALKFFVPTIAQRRVGRPDEGVFARRELLVGYEPGYRPIPWGPERAKLIKAGSDIVVEAHFNPNGTESVDYSEIGLYIAKAPPRERVVTMAIQNMGFSIPPGDANYKSDATQAFTEPVKIVSVQPHMHLRGKAMDIRAVTPDGRASSVINVPRYDFMWQTTYFLKDPIALPAGSRIDCAAWFDNSPNNKWNPDATRAVPWGDQSWDEMHIGFTEVAFDAKLDAERIIKVAK
jgi:hypothetical protein